MVVIACPEPQRAASLSPRDDDDVREFIGGQAPPMTSRSDVPSKTGIDRFTTTFAPHKMKRVPSPFASDNRQPRNNATASSRVIWRRVFLIGVLAVLLVILITAITMITPRRPVVYVKRVSVPSTSSYSIAANGNMINVSGYGTLSVRLYNPNLVMKQSVKNVNVEVFWVGYQGEDKDYFETAPLATGETSKTFTLYPKDTIDSTIDTEFEHTGTHNVDPIWLDFIRRCLNQDEESRHLRLVFRVTLVVKTAWWGERRRRYLLPQDLPCPMTTGQIVQLFKTMRLSPPDQSQVN